MTWLLAEDEGEMLAAIAVFALGTRAWYMWGASGESGRNLMPNHALQWAAMRWAKARGCTLYDLWGIPDEVGANPDAYTEPESWGEGGLWGVYRFKQGFGGQVVRYTGAWDMPLSRPGYALYKLALRVRRRERGHGDRVIRGQGDMGTRDRVNLNVIGVTDRQAWDAALLSLPQPHVLQSWAWGETKAQTGWRARRLLWQAGSSSRSLPRPLLIRRLNRRLPVAVAYVPKGPILDWSDAALVEAVLGRIEAEARRAGAIFVKIDPDVRADTAHRSRR